MKNKLAKENCVKQVMRVIKPQFIDTPEGRFMYAIVAGAVRESVGLGGSGASLLQARRYLFGDVIHAELAGVDVDWIRSTLHKVGLVGLWVAEED